MAYIKQYNAGQGWSRLCEIESTPVTGHRLILDVVYKMGAAHRVTNENWFPSKKIKTKRVIRILLDELIYRTKT